MKDDAIMLLGFAAVCMLLTVGIVLWLLAALGLIELWGVTL